MTTPTPPEPQGEGQQPGPGSPPPPDGGYPPPPPPEGGYPPPPPAYYPSQDQGARGPQGLFAAPPGVPRAAQNAFLCWMALAALVLLSFVINLAVSIGSGGTVSGFLGVALAAGAAFGAREMRAGKRSGRTIAAVCGGVLGVFQLLGLVLILGVASLIGGAVVLISLLLIAIALALVVAGMVFMFKPEVSAFLRR
ncbi:MAG: hypothetical protein JWR88_1211 [Pseudonocardia sp.]|nr:hypothetical protein [Pseudonocardia sp.]